MGKKKIKTYVIDLFCGAGGTSTAVFESNTNMEVIWCVNHDETAIRSHKKNYPNCIHSVEDIRTFNVQPLVDLVNKLRREDPTCKIAIWASLECTNFSNAKNGPKDADSRTLAEDMYRYLVLIKPDFFWVENVVEFLEWGPLYPSGAPNHKLKGQSYKKWHGNLMNMFNGYAMQILTSADFGGRTIRRRLFLQYSLDAYCLGFPKPTHSKEGLNLKKWLPIKDVLDFEVKGKSIFNRKRPLVKNTHKRIYKGLMKYGPSAGVNFGIKYYGQLGFQDIKEPSATLTTKDRISLVDIVTSFVHNPQYGGSNRSIEDPSATLIARQDKAPIGLTSCTAGDPVFSLSDTDDEYFQLIKEYCIKHNISDILLRPLSVKEMLRIQGFPEDYTLGGTMTEQKKHIGNSVEVKVGIALFQSIDSLIQNNPNNEVFKKVC